MLVKVKLLTYMQVKLSETNENESNFAHFYTGTCVAVPPTPHTHL